MIIIDSSETRDNTTMPSIKDAVISDNLESFTGADFMVSPLSMPFDNETLIKEHIKNGAIFVQRKHGRDLASSVGVRLNNSLAKMLKWGAIRPQCVLMFIGTMTCNRKGNATIDGDYTGKDYWHILAATQKWVDRGGSYVNLQHSNMIEKWCAMRMKHMAEYKGNHVKEIWPMTPQVMAMDKFLQILQPIDDGRVLLASIPGIGPKTANLLNDEFNGDIGSALCWLTYPQVKSKRKIKGIAKATVKKAREYLNLDPTMWLALEVMDKELWQNG